MTVMNKIDPYPGFRPYKHTESSIFFGREKEQDELLHYLASHNFVSILGMSGVGKSSLIQAGLLADLHTGFLANSHDWIIAELYPNPNKQPFEKLSEKLSERFNNEVNAEQLRTDTQVELIEALLAHKNNQENKNYKLLILADQFEEVFDLEHKEIKAFTDFLLNITNQSMNIYVVLGMRAEFIGKCSPYYEFAERVNQTVFLVPRLKSEKLTDVIRNPLDVVNTEVSADDKLIKALKIELSDSKEDLTPSLQFVLRKLYRIAAAHKDNKSLSLELYQEEIKVDLKQAISNEAEKIYQNQLEETKQVIEVLFRELIDVSHGEFTKRAAKKETIFKKINKEQQLLNIDVDEVIELFKNENFTVLKEIDSEYIEITHDNLIEEWTSLNQWAKDEQYKQQYPEKEQERANAIREKQEIEKRKIITDKLKIIIILAFMWLFMIFAVFFNVLDKAAMDRETEILFSNHLVIASIYSQSENYSKAQKSLDKAGNLYNQEQAHPKSIISRLMDSKAMPPTLTSTYKLLDRVTDIQGTNTKFIDILDKKPLFNLAISDNKKLLAISNKDNKIYILDSNNALKHSLLIDGIKEDIDSNNLHIAFHPTNEWLVTSSQQELNFWSLSDGNLLPTKLEKFDKPINAILVSKQLSSLFVATDSGIFKLGLDINTIHKPQSPVIPINIESINKNKLAILHDTKKGDLLISCIVKEIEINIGKKKEKRFINTIEIWSLETYKKIATLPLLPPHLQTDPEYINTLAVNKNKQLAVATNTGNIYTWNLNDLTERSYSKKLLGHQSDIYGLSFIGDTLLASGGRDANIRIWDTDSGVTVKILKQHTADVNGLAYIGGNKLISIGYDHKIIKWYLEFPYQSWIKTESMPVSAAINLLHQNILVGFEDGSLALYALPLTQQSLLWKKDKISPSDIKRVAFNEDGNLAATVGYDEILRIWAVTPTSLQLILQEEIENSEALIDVDFAPNPNNKIAIATYSGKALVFNLEFDKLTKSIFLRKKELDEQGHGILNSISFDITGQKLLTASQDGELLLWDLVTGMSLNYTHHNPTQLMWAGFNSDSRKIVASNVEGSVLVYNTKSTELEHIFNGHKNTIYRAEFSPNGQHIFSVSSDRTVKIWNTSQDLDIENIFTLNLPANNKFPTLEDMGLSCEKTKGCWLVVPLFQDKKLVSYNLDHIY
ncbi:hypothetical protein [Candidatus Albibeggiatoa sp. nov. NOAA]|uniref:NACHT and WD repeat domain-containing protein n=1 Tax=Candidatus Albibeggiatoa sp. nov. NOAA TaxID=3162724 RepID=UPI0032F707B6|nr:hypothetical protein [Thiotrichaceae bacterium]